MKPSHSPLDNRRRSSRRKGKSLDNEGIDATRKENSLNSDLPKQIEKKSAGRKPPLPSDNVAYASSSHFRHIDGDESSSDNQKPSAFRESTNKDSSTTTTAKTTSAATKDNGILSLFEGTLHGRKPLFTAEPPPQPTREEIRAAKFVTSSHVNVLLVSC
jgi:hypothetical protein